MEGWHYYNGEPLTDEEWARVQSHPQGFTTATMVVNAMKNDTPLRKKEDTVLQYLGKCGFTTVYEAQEELERGFPSHTLVEYSQLLTHHTDAPTTETAKTLYDFLSSHKTHDGHIMAEIEYRRVHQKEFLAQLIPHFMGSCVHAQNILDVGCGIGIVTNYLAENNPYGHFIGVDISEKSAKVARNNAQQRNISNIEYLGGDLLNLRDIFPEKTFDSVLLIDILDDTTRDGHFTDFMLEEKMEEVAYVTASEGLVTVKFSPYGGYACNWENIIPECMIRHHIHTSSSPTYLPFTYTNGMKADSFIVRGRKK